MFKLTDENGEIEFDTHGTLNQAYQKANDECIGRRKDIVVWEMGRINAIFLYGQQPTVIVKPNKQYTMVLVGQ